MKTRSNLLSRSARHVGTKAKYTLCVAARVKVVVASVMQPMAE